MASAITGTSELAGAPTAYSGSNSSLSQAIQTIWSKEILFQAMPILRFEPTLLQQNKLQSPLLNTATQLQFLSCY